MFVYLTTTDLAESCATSALTFVMDQLNFQTFTWGAGFCESSEALWTKF